jgi:hypothetical protein
MSELEKRVAALEEAVRRIETRNRGYLTQAKAAEYIGRSKEFLRERHALGIGPARMPNGQYAIRDLDEWMRREPQPPENITHDQMLDMVRTSRHFYVAPNHQSPLPKKKGPPKRA